ncbi:MAG: DNA-binding protein [Clostridiales bacterium]|nr:DNA-binding protein [Clostridiales bacterium]
MANNVELTVLLDLYGEVLTEKQRQYLDYYYNNDLSLAEIAENEKITRQGVRDSIKRAEAILYDLESKLHFEERLQRIGKAMDEICECADIIDEYNLSHNLSREVNNNTERIKSIADSLTK